MEDGDIKHVFETVTDQLVEEWKTTFDPTERDNLWRTVRAVQLLQQNMAGLTSEARLSNHAITQIRRIK